VFVVFFTKSAENFVGDPGILDHSPKHGSPKPTKQLSDPGILDRFSITAFMHRQKAK
jgi:hypothetical protein